MLDTAIVGAGLCGLSLARQLQAANIDYALYEARSRLGGRILSKAPPGHAARSDSTQSFDLGATWFWPESEPLISELIAGLDLPRFAQYDSGAVLRLRDPDKSPETAQVNGVHAGAQRLRDGMAGLIRALAAVIPATRIHCNHALIKVRDCHDHVELHFLSDDNLLLLKARRVVLALPPRLLAEQVRFEPELAADLLACLRATPTWMAAQAKAVLFYEQASWRAAGLSGNAFVEHEQAVFKEIFDACSAGQAPEIAALGGFIALAPTLRSDFHAGLPLLMGSQMSQVLGTPLEPSGQLYQDWANELYTYGSLDSSEPGDSVPPRSDATLRLPRWEHKLYFGGTETASHGGGHMEGAVSAANHIARELLSATPAARQPSVLPAPHDAHPLADHELNAASLQRFKTWVQAQTAATFAGYRQHLNYSLATQQREQLTQRAMLAAMEQLFSRALSQLFELPFATQAAAVERGRSALTPDVQAAFDGCMQRLLDEVTAFNQTSCALSNFPDEHQLSREYVQTILRDLAAAWREFLLAANQLLLDKSRSGIRPPATAGIIQTRDYQ